MIEPEVSFPIEKTPAKKTKKPDPALIFGREVVKLDEATGRHYVDRLTSKVDGTTTMRRRYGDLVACVECGREFLKINPKAEGYCSRSCARKGKPNRAKAKPESKKSQRDWCDRLFSMAVRERGACERCGATRYVDLQCAHIVSRSYLAIRWDWGNAFCLCKSCHVWGHNNPLEWDEFVASKIGQSVYDELRHRGLAGKKNGIGPEYPVIFERLEVLLEEVSGLPRPEARVEYTYRQRERVRAA